MIKLALVLVRNPALSYDEFVAHYRDVHVPMALEGMAGLRRYVVNQCDETNALLVAGTGNEPRPSRADAITFQWFDDLADFTDPARMFTSPAAGRALADDAAGLFGGMHAYVVDEVEHWDYHRDWPDGQQSKGHKRMSAVARLEGQSPADHRRHYAGGHGPLTRVQHVGVWRYCQNFVTQALTPGAPPVDTFAELHFESVDDLQHRMYLNETSPSLVQEDIAHFLTIKGTWSVTAAETVWRS
jgi:uncharacterized protein (TIGR02118 family)